jgi:hypothetical protein
VTQKNADFVNGKVIAVQNITLMKQIIERRNNNGQKNK